MTRIEMLVDMPVHEPSIEAVRKRGDVRLELVEPVEAARELPLEKIRSADALFCMYPPTNIAAMEKLRWIQLSSAGYSQIFGLGLAERGVRVTNGRGCFDIPIAEWNIAMMVNLARNLRQMIRNQDSAVWDRSGEFQQEIRGRTVGLWGYGGIGRETARLARLMGMTVHAFTRSGVSERREIYCEPGTGDPEGVLPHKVFVKGQELEFLSGLDFLILAMPLTAATEGIVGEAELRALPRHAYLLNPARGPLVEAHSLLAALTDRWIAGAAIDTHYAYPLPPDHPLWRMPNVILTPHISGSTLNPQYGERIWRILAENLSRYLAGRSLLNELTAAQMNGG